MNDDCKLNLEVIARYRLCIKCLEEESRPGSPHCLEVINKRFILGEKGDPWLNPYYVDNHPELEQPVCEHVCDYCPCSAEHDMREFVNHL